MASTASLSPCTTLSTPAGKPASWNSSQTSIEAEGSRSDGFSTKVLPQAMATGYIHIGTMAGKLKGVMPATTPSGWRSDQLSISGPTLRLYSPFRRCGMPQAKSTTSMPRASSPARVVMGLAVLARDGADDLVGVAIEQLLEAEHVLDALERRRRAPADGRLLGGGDGGIHFRGGRERQFGDLLAGRGIVDGRDPPRGGRDLASVDGVLDGVHGSDALPLSSQT